MKADFKKKVEAKPTTPPKKPEAPGAKKPGAPGAAKPGTPGAKKPVAVPLGKGKPPAPNAKPGSGPKKPPPNFV